MSRQERLILLGILLVVIFIAGVFVGYWACDYLNGYQTMNPNMRSNLIYYQRR